MSKIFSVYWQLSKPKATIPDNWPSYLSTSWNMANPVSLEVNRTDANVYLAVSCSECLTVLAFCVSLHQQNYALLAEQ